MRKKRRYIYELYTSNLHFGYFETDLSPTKFDELLDRYKYNKEDYDIPGFLNYLRRRKVKCKWLTPDGRFYF